MTLLATIRKHLGIKGGDVMLLNDHGGEITLRSGITIEIQHYSDEQIAQWDANDQLEPQEKARILDTVSRLKSKTVS